MTTEQLILENAMLRQHIVDNQLAMPEEISTAQPAVSFGRALRNHLEAVAALPVEEVPASNDVTDALERMDALLRPGLGLLAVGDKSATAEASRRDMATIRAALAATQVAPAAVAVPAEREGFEAHIKTRPNYFDGMLANSKYSNDFKVIDINNQWVGWQARAALASVPASDSSQYKVPAGYRLQPLSEFDAMCAVQAAAPVVLPEPFALYDGEKWYANEEAAICSCANMQKLQKVYLEQQVRALLATGNNHSVEHDSTPQAQADARDAEIESAVLAERERICAAIKAEDDHCVTQGDYMLDSDDCIKVARGEWERPVYDAAIAAAKGE